MKNILVAGAGHGGLSAALTLAKNGYSVTVIEKSSREDIGHDWHDAMDIPAFRFADIPVPPEECFTRGLSMCYYNPKKTATITTDAGPGLSVSNCITIDRKFLISYLIELCEAQGVSFIFDTEILKALTDGTRVTGICTVKDSKEENYYADMIIDSAGMNSPVRLTLPDEFGIQKEFPLEDTFEIYRAYYENTQQYFTSPHYCVYFFNCKKPGLDWVITEENYIDVLIGKFGSLSKEEIDASLEDIRENYPGIGTEPIRGGVVAKIPLSKTLPLLVADNFAIIGDSAGMTVPLNGSGIDLSLQAGKLLATAIMAAEKVGYKKEALWQYQYRYFTLFGNALVPISILRRFMSVLSAEHIDFFLEKGLLTATEIGMAGGNFSAINVPYIIDKMITAAPLIKLLPKLVKAVKTLPLLPAAISGMPKEYNEEKVRKWIELYKEL